MLVELNKKQDTEALAKKIAKSTRMGDVILLKGDLGVGKTFFAKNFIKYFFPNQDVTVNSPTFNLVQTYTTNLFTIWHFDLYRLKTVEEIFELGVEQAFDEAVSIIEWPELIQTILPKNVLEIEFSFNEKTDQRQVSLRLYGEWKNRSDEIL
ncbi:MAG: tRNA (adenosine(37)-N6)-threonylcarbamoyltransferase complex ATPase subunit type 1 TsaE [Alphaproteobacteria bacterium]